MFDLQQQHLIDFIQSLNYINHTWLFLQTLIYMHIISTKRAKLQTIIKLKLNRMMKLTSSLDNKFYIIAISSLLMMFGISACQPQQYADEVIIGKIWTGDPENPWAEAMALAGDTLMAVGTKAEIQAFIGSNTRTTEAGGDQLIVPGFIDSHTHFMESGFELASVQLREAKTPKEFIQRIADYAKTVKPGTWITGGNWDHQNWGGELPDRAWIDSVTKDNPVWVNRIDGHMNLANSLALKLAGISNEVQDVKGGEVIRKNGNITGLFKDNALNYVRKLVPPPAKELEDVAFAAAMDYNAARGITSVVSVPGTGYGDFFEVYKRASKKGSFKIRMYAVSELKNWEKLAKQIKEEGSGDKWLRFGGAKGFVDGSLGSHTAAFLQPFTDAPKDSGFFVIQEDVLYRQIKSADSAGLHLLIHAIGDRSINMLLNLYEKLEKEAGSKDRRLRMEHAQHIQPSDIKRFKTHNVIASVQPYHAIDDGRWAEKVIGHERAKTTYAFRSLLDEGARLVFGSDWFVAPADPLLGIYAAVTRRTLDDKNPDGWIPEQKVTVEEALKAYTIDAAYATFEDQIKGSLKKGKLADFVILDKDITKIDPVQIQSVKVLSTVVGGKQVYKRN
jgi:predicted amidohydrolase YtcJ